MCSKKVFGGGSKQAEAPTPAVAVAAPNSNVESAQSTNNEASNVRAKGKRKLTIPNGGASTGVNL